MIVEGRVTRADFSTLSPSETGLSGSQRTRLGISGLSCAWHHGVWPSRIESGSHVAPLNRRGDTRHTKCIVFRLTKGAARQRNHTSPFLRMQALEDLTWG